MSEQKAFIVQRIGIIVAGSVLLGVGVGGLAVSTAQPAPVPASAVSEGSSR
jgi:hypothetical protein